MKDSFKTITEFGKKYNPKNQVNFAKDIRDTIEGDYSTLEVLDMAFGENTSAKWLTVSITDINTVKNVVRRAKEARCCILIDLPGNMTRHYKKTKKEYKDAIILIFCGI